MTQFTEHLSEEELACHDGTLYPFDQVDDEDTQGRTWRETRAAKLGGMFEKIRALWGLPLPILSAYRTVLYQAKLKAAAQGNDAVAQPDTSQHPKGRALDLRPPAGVSVAEFHVKILVEFEAGRLDELGGLGIYDRFVHVDCRPRVGGRLARWSGQTHPVEN
jgi:hypothetical protein